ncbi:ROK family transcriptional regulator [Streptomyces beijiangensis]|uniref:ROK family transcriptional regulator n=1 Tax=Streptomyces beijiangensis TaxID=163361 RepID=A0A939F1F6_9ACTN|nr:ROK family transcriptional regulator [Streptomyces beijiangensis]MBO0510741.1 ROK family transcriptional regulator [Streptomyces beijiangensis]
MNAPLPNTQQGMRRRNLSLVMHAVAGHGPLSRAGVAGRIGLTRAAVSSLVDELIRGGLLVELGREQSGAVGRPGSALSLSCRGPVGIGAEIGVDHLAVCAVDLHGKVRARASAQADHRGRPAEPVLKELAELIRQVTEAARAEGLRPAGIAVAVPGLVARDTQTVVRAPNLGWEDIDLGDSLPYGVQLSVDNEANLGALAELWIGGDPAPQDFVHVSAEIGIGAAVVVEGRLLRGTHGYAGELGHVPVRPEGPACACGGRGCLEQYAGEEAVLRAAGLTATGRGVDLLAARAADGDRTVRRALSTAGAALGIALAGTVNLLDPQAVILGGALSRLAPWLLPSLERELTRRTAEPARPTLTVSRLGSEGPLLGAAHSVVRAVLDDPSSYAA